MSHQGYPRCTGQPQEYSTAARVDPLPWMEWNCSITCNSPPRPGADSGCDSVGAKLPKRLNQAMGEHHAFVCSNQSWEPQLHRHSLLFACPWSSHTHLIHNRPHQGPTLRTQAMKRAGDRTRTGDVQLGKRPVWTPSPGWNGTAPSPATAHLGQELIQVVTQLGPSCRSGSIKPWGNTTPLCAAINHGSPNCTVTVCCSPAHGAATLT